MYLTTLPDHTQPGFDEQAHFNNFSRHNIIFNAAAYKSHCEEHIGCLSLKTVRSGEEWYTINRIPIAVRPPHFLILNHDQPYGSSIDTAEKVKSLSVFFQKDFAGAVYYDMLHGEQQLLEHYLEAGPVPEFYQTLHLMTPDLQLQLDQLINELDTYGYRKNRVDEHLALLLQTLITHQHIHSLRARTVKAVKHSTRKEIYKRICIVRDILHSSYSEHLELEQLGQMAALSVPQLIRQFRTVFQCTPHQYLTRIRLQQAMRLLIKTDHPVQDITWMCGFENASAFGRIFRQWQNKSPFAYRKEHHQN
ncbi:AraC family transcriptional regulator [Niabella pedocola]|uniref:AraC family transcriptional regulator n=1 Tax=Niabella pedocola TaxID=1752077 RepID=A0ABS8PMT9_9BACT|nr:AraC family transcriptional regulator [Niabella pedocola]MCD2422411.1 AraC family transcriptional regulator [Niabella pedocola]